MSEVPTYMLCNSVKMPMIGLGTYQARGNDVEKAVGYAIDIGYRMIDTAYMYQNFAEIGKAITTKLNEGIVKRDDLFVVSKLHPIFYGSAQDIRTCMEKHLQGLNLDYLDLFLIHLPIGFHKPASWDDHSRNCFTVKENGEADIDMNSSIENVWKTLELLVDEGKTKAIGVSNFSIRQMERIMKISRIPIASNQVECHAHLMRDKLYDFCQSNNISFMAYGPIGAPYRESVEPTLIKQPIVLEISKKYNKTPAQILLRYLIQMNRIVIPKSTHEERIKENFEIFDFEIAQDDVNKLQILKTKNMRLFTMKGIKGIEKHPEYKEAYEME